MRRRQLTDIEADLLEDILITSLGSDRGQKRLACNLLWMSLTSRHLPATPEDSGRSTAGMGVGRKRKAVA